MRERKGQLPPMMPLQTQTLVKAKRGRPPSKPPTKEVLKSRRKVNNCQQNTFFYIYFPFYIRQQMLERGEEWTV